MAQDERNETLRELDGIRQSIDNIEPRSCTCSPNGSSSPSRSAG